MPRVPRLTAQPERIAHLQNAHLQNAHLQNAHLRLGRHPQWRKTMAVVIHKPSHADRYRETAYCTRRAEARTFKESHRALPAVHFYLPHARTGTAKFFFFLPFCEFDVHGLSAAVHVSDKVTDDGVCQCDQDSRIISIIRADLPAK